MTDDLRAAYDQLDYELTECHANLSVPTATPARFAYATDDTPATTDAEAIADALDSSELVCIDVLAENGDKWYEFSVSATVYVDEHRCKLSASTAGVTVLKNREQLSYAAFEQVVETVAEILDATLVFDADAFD